MYTGLFHYLHNLLLSPCLGSSLMPLNIDNINEDSGSPAHLVQVREVLEGSSPGALPQAGAPGDIFTKIKLLIPWWRCQKIQLQQTSSQCSQGRGPGTGRVGRAGLDNKESSKRNFLVLYLPSTFFSISTNTAPINKEFCCWLQQSHSFAHDVQALQIKTQILIVLGFPPVTSIYWWRLTPRFWQRQGPF